MKQDKQFVQGFCGGRCTLSLRVCLVTVIFCLGFITGSSSRDRYTVLCCLCCFDLMASLAMAAEKLRDLSQPIDVHLLDATVSTFYGTGSKEEVLEGVIKYRWNALPVDHRDGMKNYISEVIVQLSSNEASFRLEMLYVNKLNVILVQILKHEWPARWRSFIPDLVAAAKTSETICENCMTILKPRNMNFLIEFREGTNEASIRPVLLIVLTF